MKHNEPVSHIMSNELLTVHAAQKVSEVYTLLTENRIHHVPVVNGEKPIGLISSSDMMKLSLDAYGTPDSANAAYLDSQFSIEQVMSSDLVTIGANEPIRTAQISQTDRGVVEPARTAEITHHGRASVNPRASLKLRQTFSLPARAQTHELHAVG